MKLKSLIFVLAFVLCSLVPAWADSVVSWNFSSPTGTLGTSQVYTANSLAITAYGFTSIGTPIDLAGKAAGADENGLGIAGAEFSEIGNMAFVQLDFTQVLSQGFSNGMLTIQSIQAGESYQLYGSNTLGVLGTPLGPPATLDDKAFLIPEFGQYNYIGVTAADAHSFALIGSASASSPVNSTPEPASLLLVGSATGLLGWTARRLRRGADTGRNKESAGAATHDRRTRGEG